MPIMPIRSATEATLWRKSVRELKDRMRHLMRIELQLRLKRIEIFGAERLKLSLRIEKACMERRRTENVLIEKIRVNRQGKGKK
jgi:hypothetical protein